MKYLTTIHDINNINNSNDFDGFIVGNNHFAGRIAHSFDAIEINKIISLAKKLNKEVFLTLNKMYTDEQFRELDKFLDTIKVSNLTGIIASDFGVVQFLIEKGLSHLIVWQGETLSTNIHDFNFLKEFNVLGAFTAKEITIKDILEISENKQIKHFITGHGHLNMFYSKRHLISNFKEKYGLEFNPNKYSFKILENKRDGIYFPILEDLVGTHVFRSIVTNSFKYLNDINANVDYFVIDTIFKDDEYGKDVLYLYKNGYDEEKILNLKDKYQESWDDGFYDVKTVYLKEEL